MSFSSLGDMAQAFSLRHRNTLLKTQIQQLNTEIVSGQAADLADHLGGSYAGLTSIERDIRIIRGYEVNISEAKQLTDVMQVRMEQISEIASDFAGDLITATASGDVTTREALAAEAKVHFSTVVDILNSQSAGRSLFSGDTVDQPALTDSDAILAELDNVLIGSNSLVDVETRINLWFADPLGFEATAYTGSDDPIASFKMSENTSVSVDLRANSAEMKNILMSFAKASIVDSGSHGLSSDDQNLLRQTAAENMMTAQLDLVGQQAHLGLAQEQIAEWGVRTQTERIGLDYAKGALLAVDPYETATALEAAQFQLESLYTVTVRLSQLSLVNFLR
ncbi:MAG: flagellin [Aliishimia sp.]